MTQRWRQLIEQTLHRELAWVMPPLLGIACVLFAWRWDARQASKATQWQHRTQRCTQLADDIRALRRQPRRFDDRLMESHTLVKCVEQSAASAGLQLKQIVSIRPEPAQRVRGTNYVETSTRVRLTSITTEQIARLAWQLQSSAPGLTIPHLHLWATSSEAQTWEAELVVVGLAYIPPSTPGSAPVPGGSITGISVPSSESASFGHARAAAWDIKPAILNISATHNGVS